MSKLRDGTQITVVHNGKTVDAIAVDLGYPAWAAMPSGSSDYGPLGDEHCHWIRGWLYPRLWPPHRKRAEALVVAYALGPPVPTPEFSISPTAQLLGDVLALMKRDRDRLFGDAHKLMQDAERLATGRRVKSLTRRWP